MPESVTDRPTKSHSYVFLLSQDARGTSSTRRRCGRAISEHTHERRNAEATCDAEGHRQTAHDERQGRCARERNGHVTGRNIRSVWNIATQPYPEAHFATYPEELVRALHPGRHLRAGLLPGVRSALGAGGGAQTTRSDR